MKTTEVFMTVDRKAGFMQRQRATKDNDNEALVAGSYKEGELGAHKRLSPSPINHPVDDPVGQDKKNGMKRGPKFRERPGDRFDVAGFFPPERLAQIARERTEGMVAMYVSEGARAKDTMNLAASCYMQGLTDAIESIHRAGLIVTERPQ